MTGDVAGDVVRASVFVAVAPEVAFRCFVEEIDQWWRRGVRFRTAGAHGGILRLEPGIDGRLFESWQADGQDWVFETGRVVAWRPPAHFAIDWRVANFAPDELTRVAVDFDAEPGGTRVTVTHRGWAALRADHPVRHGEPVERFIASRGMWWGALLLSLRAHVARGDGGRWRLPLV